VGDVAVGGGFCRCRHRRYRPERGLADEPFLQEIGRQVPSAVPLTAVAAFAGQAWVGSTQGLWRLEGERFAAVAGRGESVTRLVVASNTLWAVTSGALHRLQAGAWKTIPAANVADVTEHGGETIVASGSRLWRVRDDALEPLTAEGVLSPSRAWCPTARRCTSMARGG